MNRFLAKSESQGGFGQSMRKDVYSQQQPFERTVTDEIKQELTIGPADDGNIFLNAAAIPTGQNVVVEHKDVMQAYASQIAPDGQMLNSSNPFFNKVHQKAEDGSTLIERPLDIQNMGSAEAIQNVSKQMSEQSNLQMAQHMTNGIKQAKAAQNSAVKPLDMGKATDIYDKNKSLTQKAIDKQFQQIVAFAEYNSAEQKQADKRIQSGAHIRTNQQVQPPIFDNLGAKRNTAITNNPDKQLAQHRINDPTRAQTQQFGLSQQASQQPRLQTCEIQSQPNPVLYRLLNRMVQTQSGMSSLILGPGRLGAATQQRQQSISGPGTNLQVGFTPQTKTLQVQGLNAALNVQRPTMNPISQPAVFQPVQNQRPVTIAQNLNTQRAQQQSIYQQPNVEVNRMGIEQQHTKIVAPTYEVLNHLNPPGAFY